MILGVVSCSYSEPMDPNVIEVTNEGKSKHLLGGYETTVRTVKIEGCEYLYGERSHAAYFTHKGNCTNVIHTKQQEK